MDHYCLGMVFLDRKEEEKLLEEKDRKWVSEDVFLRHMFQKYAICLSVSFQINSKHSRAEKMYFPCAFDYLAIK